MLCKIIVVRLLLLLLLLLCVGRGVFACEMGKMCRLVRCGNAQKNCASIVKLTFGSEHPVDRDAAAVAFVAFAGQLDQIMAATVASMRRPTTQLLLLCSHFSVSTTRTRISISICSRRRRRRRRLWRPALSLWGTIKADAVTTTTTTKAVLLFCAGLYCNNILIYLSATCTACSSS